jgi:hypothetical protein
MGIAIINQKDNVFFGEFIDLQSPKHTDKANPLYAARYQLRKLSPIKIFLCFAVSIIISVTMLNLSIIAF